MKQRRAEWERDAIRTGGPKGDQNVVRCGRRTVKQTLDKQSLKVWTGFK
jgi:hypothetical protein